MRQRTHLSPREKRILTLYLMAFMGTVLLCVIFGLLGRNLSPAFMPTNTVEVAVIMPTSGDNAGIGTAAYQAVKSVVDTFRDPLAGSGWVVNVQLYDAGETLNSAAWAAWRALHNKNTIAIIGPYDSRQALVVAEMVQKSGLPVISPAASSPALSGETPGNLIRLVPDISQERALLAELIRQERYKIFEIGAGLSYVQDQMNTFNQAVTGSAVELVGVAQVGTSPAEDIAAQLQSTEADSVVYFGDAQQLQGVLDEMVAAGLRLPVYTLDTVDYSAVTVYNRTGIEIYRTSPYLNPVADSGQSDLYLSATAAAGDAPLAYESSLASGLVVNSLFYTTPRYISRDEILSTVQRTPLSSLSQSYHSVYIYHLPSDLTNWVLINLNTSR